METFWNCSIAENVDLIESAYRRMQRERKNRISDNCVLAEAIAANVALLFDDSKKPFLKPWDFYPDLFKEEQQAYEKDEEERQWQEYMERRREYNEAFNHRRQA